MFLGYVDDSADQKHRVCEVLTTVLVHDKAFAAVEGSQAIVISGLIPEDRLDKFEEFKAWQLYGGYGVFEGIDQDQRFTAIRFMLSIINDFKIPIVYGAVDLVEMKKSPYASANPIDIAFRTCLPIISMVMTEETQRRDLGAEKGVEYALIIADDTDKEKKNLLRKTFRGMRTKMGPPHWGPGVWFIHDEMYFGNSRDSVGIQLADLACYFIRKHLEGDELAEPFYNLFSDQIIFGGVEPKSSEKAKFGICKLRPSNA